MGAVANALGVSRQHLSSARRKAPARRRGRPPLPEEELVARIQALIAELPTYGYHRECLKLCVSERSHAVFRYSQAPKRPANIMAS